MVFTLHKLHEVLLFVRVDIFQHDDAAMAQLKHTQRWSIRPPNLALPVIDISYILISFNGITFNGITWWIPPSSPHSLGMRRLKPVLNWANVSLRTYLEVFGETSWFLIGPTFLREPSWKYSLKQLSSGSKKLRSACSGNIRPIGRSLPLILAESRALLWMKKKQK